MIALSRHALTRSQQRGITMQLIEQILENADVEKNVGDNCTLIRVSKRKAKASRGPDRLSKVAVIWSEQRAQIVTAIHLRESPHGRRYRSNH
jgi:hypothetical protein